MDTTKMNTDQNPKERIYVDDIIDELTLFLDETNELQNQVIPIIKIENYIDEFNNIKTICKLLGVEVSDIEKDVELRKIQIKNYKESIILRQRAKNLLDKAMSLKSKGKEYVDM